MSGNRKSEPKIKFPRTVERPLDIPEILEKVLQKADLESLKAARLVNHLWKQEATISLRKKCAAVKFYSRGQSTNKSNQDLLFSLKISSTKESGFPSAAFEVDMTWNWDDQHQVNLKSFFGCGVTNWLRELSLVYYFFSQHSVRYMKLNTIGKQFQFPLLHKFQATCIEHIWKPMTDEQTQEVCKFITYVLDNGPAVKSIVYRGDTETVGSLLKSFAEGNKCAYERFYYNRGVYYSPDENRFGDFITD